MPEHAPAAAAPFDVGALWTRIAEVAEASPRDQAMVDAFEPVAWTDGTLVVRRARGGGAAGTAVVDMLSSIAARATFSHAAAVKASRCGSARSSA